MEIGNTVVVRKDLKVGKEYGMCTFSEDMKEFLGKEGTVREINKLGYFYLTIDEKDVYKKFTEEMIITEEEEPEVPEIPDENPITEEEETKPAKSGKKAAKKGE